MRQYNWEGKYNSINLAPLKWFLFNSILISFSSITGTLLSTNVGDTNSDGFNNFVMFSFGTLSLSSESNNLITATVDAIFLPDNIVVSGYNVNSTASYSYASQNVTAYLTLSVIEPVLTVVSNLTESVNTISYKVTKYIFKK
jgi:hypothetical protein